MTWSGGFGAGDNHDIWWASDDPKRLVVVHDNGAVITTDGGTTRVSVAAPTGQFYHVHLTNHFPYHVCGSKQDAGPNCGPVRVAGAGGGRGGGGGGGGRGGPPPSPYSEFYGVAGGESGYIASNPARSRHHLRRQLQRRAAGAQSPHRAERAPRSVAAQSDGPRRGGFEVPVPVDLSDHELAVQSARAVRGIERRVQVGRRRQELDDHLAGSHASTIRRRSARPAVRSRRTRRRSSTTRPCSRCRNRRSRRASSGRARTMA